MTILVLVESPAKCNKIEGFLGQGYRCMATYGHIQELPDLKHVDIKSGSFKPTFKPISSKYTHLVKLKKAIGESSEIYLATDDDREGEGIAWHICMYFGLSISSTKRIIFHEITKTAIQKAVQNPGLINMNIVNAQQGRQILDLIVGFKLSPILWQQITRKSSTGLSAGRCQTPALRLIYDNQQEIDKSPGTKVYNTTGYFTSKNIPYALEKHHNNEEEMENFLTETVNFKHQFTRAKPRQVEKKPPTPFTTSSIQQAANNEMHVSPKDTMRILQTLYEKGYITYMRTDSATYSEEFIKTVIPFVNSKWGEKYISKDVMKLTERKEEKTKAKNKKKKEKEKEDTAQEAHEAIRPTDVNVVKLDESDTGLSSKDKRMYDLVWRNTMESCMSPAEYTSLTTKLSAPDDAFYKYISESCVFAGWKIVKGVPKEDGYYNYLLQLKENSIIKYNSVTSKITIKDLKSHFTEAKLVQLLEQKGIGRPSTFSSLVEKIQDRQYVKKENITGKKIKCIDYELIEDELEEIENEREFGNEKNKLVIQQLGVLVLEFLLNNFNTLFEYEYTKQMEDKLDLIAKGESEWKELCKECNDDIDNSITPLKKEEREIVRLDEHHTWMIAKHGPVIKVDKNGETSFRSVKKDLDIKKLKAGEYKLEDILENKPQAGTCLGTYQDLDLMLKRGKFGLYLSWGENTKSLQSIAEKESDVTYDSALKILEAPSGDSNIIRKLNKVLSLRNGKYGQYIFYKTEKMKKPQFLKLKGFKDDPVTCSSEILLKWVADTYKISA